MRKIYYVSCVVIVGFVLNSFSVTPAHAIFGLFNTCKFEEPTNGNLNLTDDSFIDMSGVLPAGSTFKYFGKVYGPSEIFVGSNGYITFGEGDTDFSESIEEFCFPTRLAALWDDFNPGPTGGGEVKAEFKKHPARLIVTWDGVPEFTNLGSNTFQIILFLGTNTYHISYNGLTATDGMTGVCEGFPSSKDISAKSKVKGSNLGILYEQFDGENPFDLDGECLRGTPLIFKNSTPVIKH